MVDFVLAEDAEPAKIHMIPNCSDTDLFHPGDKDPELVERYGLQGKVVVGYTGAIGPTNAIHVVAEAARLLKERGRDDIAIIVVGDGRCRPRSRRSRPSRASTTSC